MSLRLGRKLSRGSDGSDVSGGSDVKGQGHSSQATAWRVSPVPAPDSSSNNNNTPADGANVKVSTEQKKKKILLAQGKSDSFLNRWGKMITEYERKHVASSANGKAADDSNRRQQGHESRPPARKLTDWWKYDGIKHALGKRNGSEQHEKTPKPQDQSQKSARVNGTEPVFRSKSCDPLQGKHPSLQGSKSSSQTSGNSGMTALYTLPSKAQQRRQSSSSLSLDGTAQKIVHEAINGAVRSFIVNDGGNFHSAPPPPLPELSMTSSPMLLSGPRSGPQYTAASDGEWLTYKASLGKNSSLPRLALYTSDTAQQPLHHQPTFASFTQQSSNDYLQPLSRSDDNAFDNLDYNFVPISGPASLPPHSTAYQHNVDDLLTLLDTQLEGKSATSPSVPADASKAVTLALGEEGGGRSRRRASYQHLSDLPPIGSVRLGSYIPKALQGQGQVPLSLPTVTSPREGRKVFSNQPIVTEGRSYVIDDKKGGVGAPLYGTEPAIAMSLQEVLNLYIFNHPSYNSQETSVEATPATQLTAPPPPRYTDYDLPDGGYLSETSYSKQKFVPFVIHNKQTQTAGDSQRRRRLNKRRMLRRNMATNTDQSNTGSTRSRSVNSTSRRPQYLSDVGVQTDVDDDSDEVTDDLQPLAAAPRQQLPPSIHDDQVGSSKPQMRWTVERTVESTTPVPQEDSKSRDHIPRLHTSVVDAQIEPYKVAHLIVDLTDSESVTDGVTGDVSGDPDRQQESEEELIETVIVEEVEQRIIMEVKEELELQLQRTRQSRDDVTDGDRSAVDPFWLPDKYTATVDRRMQRRTRTEQVNKVADDTCEADGGALHEAIRAAVAQQASELSSRDFMAEHTPPATAARQLQDAPARKITVRRAKTDDESSDGEAEDTFTEAPVTAAGDIVALPRVFRKSSGSTKSRSKGARVAAKESLRRQAMLNGAIRSRKSDVTAESNTSQQPVTSEVKLGHLSTQPVTSEAKLGHLSTQPVTSETKFNKSSIQPVKTEGKSSKSVTSLEEVQEELIVPDFKAPVKRMPSLSTLERPSSKLTGSRSRRESSDAVYWMIGGSDGTVRSSQWEEQTQPKTLAPPPPPPLPPTLPLRDGSKASTKAVASNDYTKTPSKTDPGNVSFRRWSKRRESSESDAFDIESILNCAAEAELNGSHADVTRSSSSAGEEMTSPLLSRMVQDAQGNWVRVTQVRGALQQQQQGGQQSRAVERWGHEELPDCEYMSVNPCDSFSSRYIPLKPANSVSKTSTNNSNVKVEVVHSHSQKKNSSVVNSPEPTESDRKLSREEFLAKRNIFEKQGFNNTESTPF